MPSARQEESYNNWHYAPAVRVNDTIYLSGIPSGPGSTIEEQTRNAFVNLERVLAACGATLDDVVELTTYHVAPKDSKALGDELRQIMKAHGEAFKNGYPAWTAVGASALLQNGAAFEVRAIAVIGAGKNTRIQRSYSP